MEFWTLIWKILFIASIVVFAGMAVWVTIGGYQDIKTLLQRLQDQSDARQINQKDEEI